MKENAVPVLGGDAKLDGASREATAPTGDAGSMTVGEKPDDGEDGAITVGENPDGEAGAMIVGENPEGEAGDAGVVVGVKDEGEAGPMTDGAKPDDGTATEGDGNGAGAAPPFFFSSSMVCRTLSMECLHLSQSEGLEAASEQSMLLTQPFRLEFH